MISLLRITFRSIIWVSILLGAGFTVFVMIMPATINTTTVHSDAVVVLTGSARRVELGYQRLQESRADRLFISGVYNETTRDEIFATLAGFEKSTYRTLAKRIELGYMARDTLGNAQEVAEWLAQPHNKNIHSLRIVTASYHMPRSLWELHRALPGITLIADPAFPPPFNTSNWWYNSVAVKLVVSEYFKTIYSIARPLLPTPSYF